jgi:hypothetical protein
MSMPLICSCNPPEVDVDNLWGWLLALFSV